MHDLLKGIRILDLTTVVLGPFATRYLGDFGADVIKVEPPEGDIFRFVRPGKSETMGAGYLNVNRNKRAVCLDLKDTDDYSRFMALLTDAHVLVHNMRPAAAERLGIGEDTMRAACPRLVYCTAPGFSSHGPRVDEPAYDDIIQAASGIADLNKGPDGAPRFLPTVLCDKVSGLHLAMAVLAGVVKQIQTGQGSTIEAPMFEGMVSFMIAEHLAGCTFDPPLGEVGYERLTSPYRKPYQTKDSYISVLPYSSAHWQRILDYIGHPFAQAGWVQSSSARSARVGELYAVLSEAMPDRTTQEWITVLKELDIPCAPINSLNDLLSDTHLAEVGMFGSTDHPTEGALNTVRSPFWVNGTESIPDKPAPNLDATQQDISWE
jgi:crotonobetainyl-CoA:carnitine CoA-transferase CaiB-like acyl-CoA transferase